MRKLVAYLRTVHDRTIRIGREALRCLLIGVQGSLPRCVRANVPGRLLGRRTAAAGR
ncbi:hypothetical protein [Streptomyces minutiscleroticus]|uniref:hypothetical protein n=1 Tax=Streptomyces minutiscleroticus TaxID=68238 RepID=UPI003D9EF69A